MKARGYIQILPERDSSGFAQTLKMARVSQRYPRDPLPGAIIVEVSIEVPAQIASVQTAEAALEAGMATFVIEPQEVDVA